MKPSDDTIRDAARGSCVPREGVGSSLVPGESYGHEIGRESALLEDKERVESEDNGV